MRRSLAILVVLAACGGGGSGTPDAAQQPPIDAAVNPDATPIAGAVHCPMALPAPSEGSCDVAQGSGTAVIVRGNVLGADVMYQDGSVEYDNGKITYVGCTPPDLATATVVTCANAAVSPGIINAHDHLSYDNNSPTPEASPVKRWGHRNEWRDAYTTPRDTTASENGGGESWNEIRQVMAGETSDNADLVTSLLPHAAGMLRDLDAPDTTDKADGFKTLDYETFPLGDQSGANEHGIPANCAWNYALTELAAFGFPGVTQHASEGIDDRSHDEIECMRTSFGGGHDFVQHNEGHVHVMAANAVDYYDMARDGTKLIWSPRSNLRLFGNTSEAQVMAQLGGTVALGTDWTYSGSANMQRELACASSWNATYLNHYFTDEDLWKMATINAAEATDSDTLIGSLEVGKLADIAVFRSHGAPDPHSEVINAQEADTLLVVRRGAVLFGEDDVVAGLDASCEQVTICSEARRICAMRDTGMSYAQLQAFVASQSNAIYPAEICSPPADEPTCTPIRTATDDANPYDGTITATDSDGDGVPDTSDNCPNVFNPARPMDHAVGDTTLVQADVDGDGIGDACDPTPVGDDVDGDGIPNTTDLCPFVSDNPEADGDSDGIGDACDFCPSQANATHVCFPPTNRIEDIQNGTIATGTNVFIEGTVTAVTYNGFFIEDPVGGAYSGVFVFQNPPSVTQGDDVFVAGKATEFHGMTEISPASVVSDAAGGTMPAAQQLTVAAAADPSWDGVLVTLTDVSAINLTYACTTDDPTCTDTNTWLLNTSVLTWDAAWTGTQATWTAAGAAYTVGNPITGPMGFRYNRTRIMPRTAADLGE